MNNNNLKEVIFREICFNFDYILLNLFLKNKGDSIEMGNLKAIRPVQKEIFKAIHMFHV